MSDTVVKLATFSSCGRYRHTLERKWSDGHAVLWVMLNPSVAGVEYDDPTIRRCIRFSKAWGYGSLLVVNLFDRIATKPRDLFSDGLAMASNENRMVWCRSARRADRIVAAWGSEEKSILVHLAARRFEKQVLCDLWCLGMNRDGSPKHPLYVRADTGLVRFHHPAESEAA